MSKIILFSILLLASSCYGQKSERGCDTLILDEHSQKVLKVNEITLQEYLINKGKSSLNLSDRKSLRSLRTLICNNSEVLILGTPHSLDKKEGYIR